MVFQPGMPAAEAEIADLRRQLAASQERVAALEAIVAKLPRTKDGVIYAGGELWYVASDGNVYCHEPWGAVDISEMYSSRESALAAKEAR